MAIRLILRIVLYAGQIPLCFYFGVGNYTIGTESFKREYMAPISFTVVRINPEARIHHASLLAKQ